MCYQEEMARLQKSFGVSLQTLAKESKVIKKMSDVFKGSTRYPNGGVIQMEQGEYLKHERIYREFAMTRQDMTYSCEILKNL